jgi:hypothetical protein
MIDCSKDILAYHNDEVTLKLSDRTAMRDRRNSNRDRLKTRLRDASKPLPREFIKQGSYAMKTMVQDRDDDYDIDDGVYFTRASLRDAKGNDMTPSAARQMVCDALKDGRFVRDPEVKTSCVRIHYEQGYHVDMPIYRIVDTASGERYEHACGDAWVESRAADVEEWFDKQNTALSPDEDNGRQLRRIVRLNKKHSRSRSKWKEQIAAGFTITKLVQEHYHANAGREDVALRETMRAIHNRLKCNLEVAHPVTPNAKLTSGPDDAKTKFLRDRLGEALKVLEVLDCSDCTGSQAADAWDQVFDTAFFSSRVAKIARDSASNSAILGNLIAAREQPRQYQKEGGGRFA